MVQLYLYYAQGECSTSNKGIKFFPTLAFLNFRILYLPSEGNRMKCWLSGCVTSHSIDVAKHVMDLVFILVRLDVERSITLKVLNDTLI